MCIRGATTRILGRSTHAEDWPSWRCLGWGAGSVLALFGGGRVVPPVRGSYFDDLDDEALLAQDWALVGRDLHVALAKWHDCDEMRGARLFDVTRFNDPTKIGTGSEG